MLTYLEFELLDSLRLMGISSLIGDNYFWRLLYRER